MNSWQRAAVSTPDSALVALCVSVPAGESELAGLSGVSTVFELALHGVYLHRNDDSVSRIEPCEYLEHLECGHQPHVQDRGAKKRTQLAGRSASGYGLESPSPGGARSQGHNTSPRDGSVYRVTP